MTQKEFQTPIPINGDDSVYRQIPLAHLAKVPGDKKKRFPNETHFSPDPDGLSVNCCRLIDLHGVYHIIGLSHKLGTANFKDPKMFRVFRFPISFVRAIENVVDVIHSPVFNGNPAQIGSPNNYAHTSLIYPDDEQIRMELADYCSNQYDTSYCPADLNLVEAEVIELRNRLDNTQYHRLPGKPDNDSVY